MGNIAPKRAQIASRCGNIGITQSQMGPDCLKMWQHRRHTVSKKRERERDSEDRDRDYREDRDRDYRDRDRQRKRRERGEREGSRTCARRLSRLRRIRGIRPGGQPPSREGRSRDGQPPSREGCYRDARSPGPRLAQGGVVRSPTD